MDYSLKWKIIENIGEGGQGKVYRVYKQEQYLEIKKELTGALWSISRAITRTEDLEKTYEELRKWLPEMLKLDDPLNQYALKVLHEPEDARDSKLASERIKREINVMQKNIHPNLIELVDIDSDYKWYVSRFYSGGTLEKNLDLFKGNFLSVLKAARPIIEGVAELHKQGYVHRDIKPSNIFIGSKCELILGDFGLIFFTEQQHKRISETYKNVGSRDWMPGWAMGMRVEQLKSTFDVFSLGKVLWAMTTGKHILPLWYFKKDEYNVEKIFPNVESVKLVNSLFEKSIVEEEKDCLPDAGSLLEEVDKTISMIEPSNPYEKIKTLQQEFDLLKSRMDKLDKKVPPTKTDISHLTLSKVSLAILDLYRQSDVTKLSLESEIIPLLSFKRIQIESAIDELKRVEMIFQIQQIGYGKDTGPLYTLTEKGKKYLADMINEQ